MLKVAFASEKNLAPFEISHYFVLLSHIFGSFHAKLQTLHQIWPWHFEGINSNGLLLSLPSVSVYMESISFAICLGAFNAMQVPHSCITQNVVNSLFEALLKPGSIEIPCDSKAKTEQSSCEGWIAAGDGVRRLLAVRCQVQQ